ncbi:MULTISPECIES: sensor domain-containing diguanylate cyclase [Pseudidiomarina]|uniref:Diguanylate cyclase with PAS/PAC sensor n=2 Tax=Pseudidiomarina TaxID=2800384 RepID=A0A368V5N1_9GAMM|nr:MULTISPECIES: sensor domain-containing diguanylate cyclase [Pseudidiomarina]PWW14487.1 diguanylate cyclase with PAS/PAC sensor [Pseudidiomarina maritima]RBP92513.1 diguanylate cyclase with PAS/PAC sensor [Pseudidiomarina tainanensis]RCW34321.1 diguanylate cyclase with PAS/PAC sensor [Pseudidiomarina tainanensis]
MATDIKAFQALSEYMDLLLDAICVVNRAGEFVYLSQGAERVFGRTPQHMLGQSMFNFIHPDDHERTRAAAQKIMGGEAQTHFVNRYLRADQSVAWIQWSARYFLDRDLRVAVARDITAQRQMEEERERLLQQLELLASTDALTGIANRRAFFEQAQQRLRTNAQLAVMYLDLNHFKQINDRFGHAEGDRLIQQAAQRLQQSLRSHDLVARMGGDEFVVLADRIQHASAAQSVAEHLYQAFESPFVLAQQHVLVTPSIGIALYGQHGETLEDLLQHADNAMYQAKQRTDKSIQLAY